MVAMPLVVCAIAASAAWTTVAASAVHLAPGDATKAREAAALPVRRQRNNFAELLDKRATNVDTDLDKSVTNKASGSHRRRRGEAPTAAVEDGENTFIVFSGDVGDAYSSGSTWGRNRSLTADQETAAEFRVEWLQPSYCTGSEWQLAYTDHECSSYKHLTKSWKDSSVDTLPKCKAACEADSKCQYITFWKNGDACKDSYNGGPYPDSSCQSGTTYCKLNPTCRKTAYSGKTSEVHHLTPTNCVTCNANDTECWNVNSSGSVKEWGLSKTSASKTFQRLKLHVKCNSQVTAYVKTTSSSGAVDILKDGVSMHTGASSSTASESVWSTSLTITDGSAHDLEIRFRGGSTSTSKIEGFDVIVGKNFSQCAEQKYCLHDLGNFTSLVTNTAKRLSCLSGAFLSSADQAECDLWKPCVDSGAQVNLKRILSAAFNLTAAGSSNVCFATSAGVNPVNSNCLRSNNQWESVTSAFAGAACDDSTCQMRCNVDGTYFNSDMGSSKGTGDLHTCYPAASSSASLAAVSGSAGIQHSLLETSVSEVDCVDPRIENPESWTCDCLDKWLALCPDAASSLDVNSTCLRAHWCADARLCSSWKTALDSSGNPHCSASRSLLQLNDSKVQKRERPRAIHPNPVSLVSAQSWSGASRSSLLQQLSRRSEGTKESGRAFEESLTGKELC